MPSHPDTTDTYLAIVTRRDATEIMLSQTDAGWTLPRLQPISRALAGPAFERAGRSAYEPGAFLYEQMQLKV